MNTVASRFCIPRHQNALIVLTEFGYFDVIGDAY